MNIPLGHNQSQNIARRVAKFRENRSGKSKYRWTEKTLEDVARKYHVRAAVQNIGVEKTACVLSNYKADIYEA